MPRWLKRTLIGATLAVIAIGVLAPFLRADYFRQRIQEALERGLGRKVEVGEVHYNLFTGPGFNVSDVTIHDDPRVGIEPLAYVKSLEARVHPASLWSGRLEFSSLRLTETKVNLTKPDDGPWNFQRLVERSAEEARALPPIYLRSSRVNFKFGDTKSVIYFDDVDLDIDPGAARIQIRFEGDPGRNDRSRQSYGHLIASGSWRPAGAGTVESQLDLLLELERSAIPDIAHLLDGQDLGVQGVISSRARIAGLVSNLQITGKLQVEDLRRADVTGRGGSWKIPYRGTLDLRGERLSLETEADTSKKAPAEPPPFSWRVAGTNLMLKPRWEAEVSMRELPAASFVEIAQHLGLSYPLPGSAVKAVIDGKLDGSVSYSSDGGFRGEVVAQGALLTLPGAQPVRLRRGELVVDNQQWRIEPSALEIGEGQTVDIEGSYSLAEHALEIRLSTPGLKVSELQSSSGRLLGAASVPLLESAREGIWKGWVRYRQEGEADGQWSGEYDIQNAVFDIAGIADPLRIAGAAVSIDGNRMTVKRLRARAGKIGFEGEYRRDKSAGRPHRLELAMETVDAAELERLLAPSLARQQGFLARTLRFGRVEAPEWLKTRRFDANISIENLRAGDYRGSVDEALVQWDGTRVRVINVDASMEQTAITGELEVDLAERAPRYVFRGKVLDAPYHGGRVEFDGRLEAAGLGLQVLAAAKAEGTVRGRALSFAPDMELRSVSSQFELTVGAAGPRWRLQNVEASQGNDLYTGQGSTQADGKLVVELSGRRPVRLTASP